MGSRTNKNNQQIKYGALSWNNKERETFSMNIKQNQKKKTNLESNNLRMMKKH